MPIQYKTQCVIEYFLHYWHPDEIQSQPRAHVKQKERHPTPAQVGIKIVAPVVRSCGVLSPLLLWTQLYAMCCVCAIFTYLELMRCLSSNNYASHLSTNQVRCNVCLIEHNRTICQFQWVALNSETCEVAPVSVPRTPCVFLTGFGVLKPAFVNFVYICFNGEAGLKPRWRWFWSLFM